MINIHGTLVSYQNKGILLIGKSGSGKSDLALRLIMEKNAVLVADDRVNIKAVNNVIYGSCPKETSGAIEIRNIGIAHFPPKKEEKIDLCVELCLDRNKLDRFPDDETIDFLGVSVTKIKLYPFDCSTIYKIIAKISGIIC